MQLAAHRRWCVISAQSGQTRNSKNSDSNVISEPDLETNEIHSQDVCEDYGSVPDDNVDSTILLHQEAILQSCVQFSAAIKEGFTLSAEDIFIWAKGVIIYISGK